MGRPIFSQIKKSYEEVESTECVHIIHNDRLIYLSGDIEEQPISASVIGLLQMFKKDPLSPITIMISTCGGSVVDMLALYDIVQYIQNKGCPIVTMGVGKIMSAGVPLLASGNKGLRCIAKHATVMMHPAYETNESGDFFHMKNATDELKRLQDVMDLIIVQNSKITKEKLSQMMQQRLDVYITADEALKLGLVDKFIGQD